MVVDRIRFINRFGDFGSTSNCYCNRLVSWLFLTVIITFIQVNCCILISFGESFSGHSPKGVIDCCLLSSRVVIGSFQ